jgi:choline dehydrogenase-like flavoprotein
MLHDHSAGRVSARRDGTPRIHYTSDSGDRRAISKGMAWAASLLLAAGAHRAVLPTSRPLVVRTLAEASAVANHATRRLDPPLAAAHPMGGLRMGSDPRKSAVGPDGRYHSARGLWVADGSLLPTSTGGPPQLTIYALGRMVGTALT